MKRRIAAICLGPALAFSLAAAAADDEELAKVNRMSYMIPKVTGTNNVQYCNNHSN